jgi:hypothetical protein
VTGCTTLRFQRYSYGTLLLGLLEGEGGSGVSRVVVASVSLLSYEQILGPLLVLVLPVPVRSAIKYLRETDSSSLTSHRGASRKALGASVLVQTFRLPYFSFDDDNAIFALSSASILFFFRR